MNRAHLAAPVFLAIALAAGCGSKDMNASIAKMNEGVEMYNQGQFTGAEKKFAESASMADENHQAWYNLGQAREKLDKYKEAAEAFRNAVKYKGDDAMYRYRLGKALIGHDCTADKESNLSEAQSNLEEAVKLNPRLYKAWECLGQIYNLQDDPKKAAEAWTKSASLNPYFGKPFIALGKLYIKWDKLGEAISVLDQGRLNVKDPMEQSNILYHLGFAYEKQGNWDKAIDAYTQAIQKSGENIDALRQRGFVFANKGDKEHAKQDLEAFVKSGGGGNAFEVQAANERLQRLLMEGP
jgi:tetratricopeptide (TPR) repeat protein